MNPYDINRPSPIDEAAITAWTARQQAAIEQNRSREVRERMREARVGRRREGGGSPCRCCVS